MERKEAIKSGLNRTVNGTLNNLLGLGDDRDQGFVQAFWFDKAFSLVVASRQAHNCVATSPLQLTDPLTSPSACHILARCTDEETPEPDVCSVEITQGLASAALEQGWWVGLTAPAWQLAGLW